MSEEWKDRILYAIAGIFCVITMLSATWGLPEMAPLTPMAKTATEAESGAEHAEGEPSAAFAEVAAPVGAAAPADTRLDLNRATADELMSLPGIGEVRAGRIIAYREKVGGFDTAEELTEVNGIGEKKLAALDGLVTVGEPPAPADETSDGATDE